MEVEVDTSLRGLAKVLMGLANMNAQDFRDNPALLKDARRRIDMQQFVYTRDEGGDKWTSYSVLAARVDKDEPIALDCEDLAAIYGAIWHVLCPSSIVEVGIVQPKPGAVAHAIARVDGCIIDGCIYIGMRRPQGGAAFYKGAFWERVNL
jgi:hypothetical protein